MLAFLLIACASPPAEPERFAALQPAFFQGIGHPADLPALEDRLDTAAAATLARLDGKPPPDDTTRQEAGHVLLYAGFLPHAAWHASEDSLSTLPRSPEQMEHSRTLLRRAEQLLPDDTRIPVILRSVDFNLAAAAGPAPREILDQVAAGAETDFFGLFTALALLRDPALYPMDDPALDRVLHAACAADRFGCDTPPPPPSEGAPSGAEPTPSGPPADDTLTRSVTGPVQVSDLLVRRAEWVLAHQPESAGEAMGRLQAAKGLLGYAQANAALPALTRYPYTATLPKRAERIEALLASTQARLGGQEAPLPDAAWYTTPDYRGPYQCDACHTYGTEASGVPK
jgi:hypothetical protein